MQTFSLYALVGVDILVDPYRVCALNRVLAKILTLRAGAKIGAVELEGYAKLIVETGMALYSMPVNRKRR